MVVNPLALTVTILTSAVVMAAAAPAVLRHLPEPADGDGKTPYGELATTRFVLLCVVLSVLAQLVALTALPRPLLPLWTVLATAGVLLAAIDARTTWLPLTLTRVAWAMMGAAILLSAGLGSTLDAVVRTVCGAVIAGALYLLIWAVSRGGFGFGDVRFAPLLGAATAGHSWTLLVWGLTLGTVLGAVHGAARMLRRRPGGFPYAPSMLGGAYLAVALAAWWSGPGP